MQFRLQDHANLAFLICFGFRDSNLEFEARHSIQRIFVWIPRLSYKVPSLAPHQEHDFGELSC